MPYRILIADDHLLVRMGIRFLLQHLPDYEIAAEAEDGRQALDALRDHPVDIALLDIEMPELSGIEVALQLRQLQPATKILFLSVADSPEIVEAALNAGAHGYLLKDFLLGELENALASTVKGETYLSNRLGDAAGLKAAQGEKPVLTARQTAILRLVAQGHSIKEIARQLDISPKTVEFHRAQIKERLGIQDTAGLTLYASRHGLIPRNV